MNSQMDSVPVPGLEIKFEPSGFHPSELDPGSVECSSAAGRQCFHLQTEFNPHTFRKLFIHEENAFKMMLKDLCIKTFVFNYISSQ